MIENEFTIAKLDDERMHVFGFASVSVTDEGGVVVDSQNEVISPETLTNAAYDYVLRSRDGGLMHERRGVARVIESCVITPEKLGQMGLSVPEFKGAKWWIGMKVDDASVWKRVKAGELKAFSIGGKAKRRVA